MEEDDKGCPMIRMAVSGWVFLLVPAYPGRPRQKQLNGCVCVCIGKQSGESVESVQEKKKVGYSGKDLQKRKVLSLEWKSEGVMDDESGESIELMEKMPLKELGETELERL